MLQGWHVSTSLQSAVLDNLTGIDACITRLRLNVKDSSLVNEALAKRLGASGVIRLNKTSVQIIVGFVAEKSLTR